MPEIKKSLKDLENKWLLVDKNKNVIFASEKPVEVLRKGKEYPFGEVTIEKIIEPGLCFF